MWISAKDKCKRTHFTKRNFPWLIFIALRLFGLLIESYEVWICCCGIYHTLQPTAATYLVGWFVFFYCHIIHQFYEKYDVARHWICWQLLSDANYAVLTIPSIAVTAFIAAFPNVLQSENSTSGNNEERVPNFCFTDKQHPEYSLKDWLKNTKVCLLGLNSLFGCHLRAWEYY